MIFFHDKGFTVLHLASLNNRLNIVQELVKDLDEKNPVAENFELLTPLHVAALGHNRSILH